MPTQFPTLAWRSSPMLSSADCRARSLRMDRRGSGSATGPPCVYWFEDPAAPLRQRAPFGRAQKGVEERLRTTRDWQRRRPPDGRPNPEDPRPRPSFTFRYPGAPTFCAYHPAMPGPIHQLPTTWDDHVDDKLRLHLLLSAAAPVNLVSVTPPTFVVDHDLLASLEEDAGQNHGETEEATNGEGPCWFLKHRLDAKRPRVHPYATATALAERLRQMGERSWKHFLVQREVHPPWLLECGRKFVLRTHVLCVVRGDNESVLELFLHDAPLVSESEDRYVLQSGARSPAYPLSEALPDLCGDVLAQMGSVSAAVFKELHTKHPPPRASEGGALYQIYGLDFMLDAAGTAFLLEANSAPRIATGAMGEAHRLYADLVVEALQILWVTDQNSSRERSGNSGAWRGIYQAKL